LSGCETGSVVAGAGDELFGLSRAFMLGGVQSLVATLWRVDDAATAAVITELYGRPGDGDGERSFAIALRAAMLRLRDSGAPSHLWAPFIVIGSPH